MRRQISYVVLAIAASVIAAGCTDSNLSTQKAQNTIDQWTGSKGTIVVQGVQEIEGQNISNASLRFEDFNYDYHGARSFSGTGVALFTLYNDGRLLLTRVKTSNGLGSVW